MNLYIGADWCSPCKTMKPIIRKLQSELSIKVVDIDINPEYKVRYGIKSVPTFINKRGERKSGIMSEQELRSFFS